MLVQEDDHESDRRRRCSVLTAGMLRGAPSVLSTSSRYYNFDCCRHKSILRRRALSLAAAPFHRTCTRTLSFWTFQHPSSHDLRVIFLFESCAELPRHLAGGWEEQRNPRLSRCLRRLCYFLFSSLSYYILFHCHFYCYHNPRHYHHRLHHHLHHPLHHPLQHHLHHPLHHPLH